MATFRCSTCGATLRAADSLAGKKGKCGKCQTVFVIPQAESVLSDAQSPIDDEARLFESVDMGRVLASHQAEEKARMQAQDRARPVRRRLVPAIQSAPNAAR